MSRTPPRLCFILVFFAFLSPASPAGEWEPVDWNTRSALEAHRAATLSAEIGGRVMKIHREMGQPFRKGEALIELNDRVARAMLTSARANLDAASAALAAAGDMYERNTASQTELNDAKRDAAEAEARLESAVRDAEACSIVAPFDGRVVEVFVNEHELVEKGRPLLSLIDDSRLTAKFLFPEEKFDQVKIGDVLDLRVPVAGVSRSARISHIAPVLDPASRTLDVWAAVDNADSALRAGMTVVLADNGTEQAP